MALPSFEETLLLPLDRKWVERWCAVVGPSLLVYESRHAASAEAACPLATYQLSVYDSLQTSGSWGANAGPFELILSRRHTPSNTLPRANTHGALNTLYKASSPDAEHSATFSPAAATKHVYLFGGSSSRNSSSTSVNSLNWSAAARRNDKAIPSQKVSAWSRWTGKKLGRLSNTGSDRTLSDRFKLSAADSSLDSAADAGATVPPPSDVLVLRAPSGSSMVRWAEVISPLLSQRSATLLPTANRRASFRKHQLHLSVGPSIVASVGGFDASNSSQDMADTSADDASSNSHHHHHRHALPETTRYLTSLLEEAGQNARRRRAESSGDNSNRTIMAAVASRQGRLAARGVPTFAGGAGPTTDQSTQSAATMAKKRLSLISIETSRRLSLRGDSAASDHSRPSTAAGVSRSSVSLSNSGHQSKRSISASSVRNSVHSDRRASSPMALFNIFTSSSSKEHAVDEEAGHGQHVATETDAAHQPSTSALGLVLDDDPPAPRINNVRPWSQLPERVDTTATPYSHSDADTDAATSPFSPFTLDYSPSLPPASPQTPATFVSSIDDHAVCAPLRPRMGYRKPSPRIDPKELEALEDRSYEMVPPAKSIPVSASMPVIARTVSPQPAPAPALAGRGKGPLARKWGKATGKLTNKVNPPPSILEPFRECDDENGQARASSPAVFARRFGGLAASFSSKTLSSHLPTSNSTKWQRGALVEAEKSQAGGGNAVLAGSPPAVTIERILPPEVMISRLDEIRKMEPVSATMARRNLIDSASRDERLGVISPSHMRSTAGRRPSTSAGTVTVTAPPDIQGSNFEASPRPCSPWSTGSAAGEGSAQERRSPRLAMQDLSSSAAMNNRHGLPAPPRLPKKRSAGPVLAVHGGTNATTLPRCQSSSVLSERATATATAIAPPQTSSPHASPILNRETAFPSPEKTSSTFNSREGKWKRHSTFSIVEARSVRESLVSLENKENQRSGVAGMKDLWSSYGDEEIMTSSGSFSFSAYCRPSTASSRVQSQVGGTAVAPPLDLESLRGGFNSHADDESCTEERSSVSVSASASVSASISEAQIRAVTGKWALRAPARAAVAGVEL